MSGVLVDSSIWSLAFRRRAPPLGIEVRELETLNREGRARIIGPIRQEVLSGIRSSKDFVQVRNRLRAFPDVPSSPENYERAAEMFNLCRARGVQGSHTDFLICAIAERHNLSVFTTDDDFRRCARSIPLRLHVPRPEGSSPAPSGR